MQNIWKKRLTQLEATAVQSLINGDSKSIENGKNAAKDYQLVKETVDKCINVILCYTEPPTHPKIRNI